MTPERYRQVGELYHAALQIEAGERSAFLETACAGDEALRREVESLIESSERASGFIKTPALAVAAKLLARDKPTDLIGRTIGRYRIVSLIGFGGMGRVYLADDTMLERRVALKLLPDHSTSDRNRVQRFRQEARAASGLNHPNILTVHEVGQVDGMEFIATEFVEGETLRTRLSRGPLPVQEALGIAVQVADALIAAHQAGIIHRDIKPENVMIRDDGYVKVLDFGLAKLAENLLTLQPAEFEAPTKAAVKTNPGVVMGTAQYMSPEQARGLPVDARTDVWSLGVIIFEMMAGERPFDGPTHGDTIVAILEREPAPLVQYTPEVSTELAHIVKKALKKDVEARYQTMKEMAIDLTRRRRLLDAEIERSAEIWSSSQERRDTLEDARGAETNVHGPARVSAAGATRRTSSVEYVVGEIRRHKLGAALVVAALVLLLSGVGYGFYRLLHQPESPAMPFQTTKVTRLTATGKVKDAAISPDGKYVVYMEEDAKGQSLWVKQVATGSSVQIIPPAEVGYWGLTFSNDGNHVYYVRNDNNNRLSMLYQVPSLGGASTKLIEHLDSAVTFSPDGQRLAFVRSYENRKASALVIVNTDGTGERTLATLKSPDSYFIDDKVRIGWSPDGKLIACPVQRRDTEGLYFGVVTVRVEDGSQMPLNGPRWAWISEVGWLSSGNGLVMLAAEKGPGRFSMQLWQLPYPHGEARRITNDLNGYRALNLTADAKSFVTVQTNRVSNIWLAPKADPNRVRQITSGTLDGYYGLTWAPDGKILYRSNASGKPDIWVMGVDGNNRRQLTHEGDNAQPSVSPGGSYIVFTSSRAKKTNIWRMDMDGGNQKQLTDGKANRNPHLSPDGRWVVYQSFDSGVSSIWKVPIDGGTPVVVSDTRANLPVVSPDGKQIACFYWDDQANPPHGVMVFPFSDNQPTKRFNIASTTDGFILRWSADSRALLYIDPRLSNIWSQPMDGGDPVQLTDFQGDQVFNFDYSPDGKWLAVARGRVTDDVVLITDLK